MSFYGNIKNTSRTQFSFDKVYPNRQQMDFNAAKDGIYAGRFVLIEYDKAIDINSFPIGYLKDGIIYATMPNSGAGGNPVAYRLTYWIPDQNNPESGTYATGDNIVSAGTIIRIPVEFNFDQTYYRNDVTPNGEASETDEPRDIFMVITNLPQTYKDIPLYYYDPNVKQLFPRVKQDGTPMTHNVESVIVQPFAPQGISYTGTADGFPSETGQGTVSQNAHDNYVYNYNIDRTLYGVSRGYDSTVWQKVYENSAAKYVMVAELNSVVPTFDLAADAPTTTPILPHFDTDSTNVYYKLHTQPQWGFRLKGSDPDLLTPHLVSSGDSITSQYINARSDKKEYPSDMTTKWKNTIYNVNNGETSERVFIVDDGNGNSAWIKPVDVRDNQDQVPAAVYFNKDGFSSENVVYSHDKQYRDWNVEDNEEMKYLVTDEISISPTGQSGHSYCVHGQKGIKERVPDIQELSIMLPSIGDSMAEIWDLIYGGRNLDPDAKTRNRDISWYNAKAVSNKNGVRLINTLGPGRYTYDTKAASTVAGILNSAQDLMGMIITDEIPDDEATANGDYIYYNPETQKYYFKHKDYKFTTKTFPNNRIPDDYDPFGIVTVKAWDKSYFYIDTATKSGWEFVLEDKFYPDKKYIEIGHVQNAMKPVSLSSKYQPNGLFFTREKDIYPAGNTYNYFVASYETFDPLKKYYEFFPSTQQLGAHEAIYIPNTYYYIDYEYVELTNTTYEANVYYYQWSVNSLGDVEYRLATEPNMEDHYDGMGEKVTAFYKRRYMLDTSLTRQPRTYYRVIPNGEQSSNAYYKQNKYAIPQPEMNYRMYAPNTYYYEGTKEQAESGSYVYELIGTTYYLRDDTSYATEDSFLEAGHSYYSIKIEYELVQGKDVIEITDENAEKVDTMRDLSEFRAGSIDVGIGQDVFYTFVDSAGATRYIEVNYNNFSKSYNAITQNYELIVMAYKVVGDPYHANGYYYKVNEDNNPKNGSYLIDDSASITYGRQYYKFEPVEGFDYSGKVLKDYFAENTLYIENPPGSGNFVLVDADSFDPNKTYLDPTLKLFVEEDTEGIYTKGAEWPMEIKQIPEGVTLATREDDWKLKELPSFGDKLITLHGLLLKLYKHIDETDRLTRDTTTARGSINLFDDLINRFSALIPGQFTIVDDYGRMHSAQHSTSQALTFKNITDSKSESRTQAAKENALITIDINSNFKKPSISITHSDANTVADTTSVVNMNDNKDDTVLLETPIVDNAGHVVGRNKQTVTLPKGFRFVTPAGSAALGDLTSNTTVIEADNTQDNLTVAAQNKWIKLASQGNTLQIAHAIVGTSFGEEKDNQQDSTPKFGDTFNIPVITVDNAGHVIVFNTETVRIPGLTFTPDTGATNDVVLDMSYRYDTATDTGIFTETRGHVDQLKIQDYNITGITSEKLANTDTIHGAFEKLQAQINAMDLAKVGGGTGEYLTDITVVDGIVTANKATLPSVEDTAVTGEFVSSVSETHGKIAVSRVALVPSITIGAGTTDAAPTVNVTVNTKTGTAQALTIATTGVYGVTKLTDTYSSTSTNLAITGAAVNKAFETLTLAGASANASQTVKSWSETNGKVSIEFQDILIKNDNVAADANIAISKIAGLQEALDSKEPTIPENTYDLYGSAAAVLGTEEDDASKLTIYGLSARIDNIIGESTDNVQDLTLYGLAAKSDSLLGKESDNQEQLTIYGLSTRITNLFGEVGDSSEKTTVYGIAKKTTEDIVGTEDDTSEHLTIHGLLAKIAELEARIEELHKPVEEENPEINEGEEVIDPET